MACGLDAVGCFMGLRGPRLAADLASTRVLLGGCHSHVTAERGLWNLPPGKQSVRQIMRQSVRQSMGQSMGQSMRQSMVQSMRQSMEQSRRQSMGQSMRQSVRQRQRMGVVARAFLPVDPWAPGNAIDSQSIASSLFAASLFPYLAFLYYITKSKTAPRLTLFGFYFLLAFVGATIPAGIYAKLHYGTSLSNVDWLHGGAESLLTLTNLFIVFGLRGALREEKEEISSRAEVDQEEETKLPLSK